MYRVKNISDIYYEIKNYDMVLTSDVVLASALNREIKRPFIGKLAYTPKELSEKFSLKISNQKIINKSETVIFLSKLFNIEIKTAHCFMDKINEIEKYTDNVIQYLNEEEITYYEKYKILPSKNNILKKFNTSFLPEKIAVIGYEFFNNLDKKVLPKNFKIISPFSETKLIFNNFYTFSDTEKLIDFTISLINKENEDDFALILNSSDSILNIIKSKLYKNEINIQVKDYLHENLNVLAFLDLLSVSFHIDNILIKEIRHFFESFEIKIDYKYNNYFLKNYILNINNDESALYFYNFLTDILQKTYNEYFSFSEKLLLPFELKEVFYKLGIYDKKITYENFSDLYYYIFNFNIEIHSSKKGVLLADSLTSVYVDKPVCIFLNPDFSWTKKVNNAPYINKEKEEDNNYKKFLILCGQGQQSFYLAALSKENQVNIPCFYFNRFFQSEINSFSDKNFNSKTINLSYKKNYSDNKLICTKEYNFDFFSQTSLKNFCLCPKKFEFSKIAPSSDKTYFLKGNLLHQYAEFYVNYKDFCNEKGDDYFLKFLLDEYMNMVNVENIEIEKTNFSVAIKNIRKFIDSLSIENNINIDFIASEKENINFFSIKLLKPIYQKNTELNFECQKFKIKGFIDLLINNNKIADYKSTKKSKTISEIYSNADFENISDNVDLQPLVYLIYLRKFNNNKELYFFYYFFMNNINDVINNCDDFKDNIIEIKYHPFSYIDFISSSEGISLLTMAGKRKDITSIINESTICDILKNYPINQNFENFKNTLAYKELELKITLVKNTQKNKDILEDFFKEIVRLKKGKSTSLKKVLFFKEDLDKFELFLEECYINVQKYLTNGFPKKPKSEKLCSSCEYKDICLSENYE